MDKFEKIHELRDIVKADSQNFQAIRELSVLLLDVGLNCLLYTSDAADE